MYGLTVLPQFRRQGIGSLLTEARVQRIRRAGGGLAVAMAMFWNARFFRSQGFETMPRAHLPEPFLLLEDFQSKTLRRSAVFARVIHA